MPGRARQRGSIEQRANALRVSVYAGPDPVTGKRIYLRGTVPGTDPAARRAANKLLNQLVAEAERSGQPASAVTLNHMLDEWLADAEIEDGTREAYLGYIRHYIRPALGDVAISAISVRELEALYAALRRCRAGCNGRRGVDHTESGRHDCADAGCAPHECRPLSASTVRQIHSIISGALTAAVRWGWLQDNKARMARRPRRDPPDPRPPSPEDAVRIADAAFALDESWGTLVWLVMTTGMRRGEVCALRWTNIDLDAATVEVRSAYVLRSGVGRIKDTKTHQMRRIALDTETVVLLREHRERCRARLASLGAELSRETYVFAGVQDPAHRSPYSPHAVSSRYKEMVTRLGIDTHLHALRHYSATELLTAGVDLRTVAGRLGHGGGGATTLRVYAAWVAASDRKAAEILGSRMPRRRPPGDE
jgi:integrase